MKKPKILVIAGPTGCGETTITNELIKLFPNFVRLTTATTRKPRMNEIEGEDYYFFDKKEFEDAIQSGDIIEYTFINNRDVYYGTYKPDLENKLNNGFDIIINPDIVGARFYKDNYKAVTIFVKPESLEVLRERLLNRQPDLSNNELQLRLANAKNEIQNEESFYDYSIINKNGKLHDAIEDIVSILRKEGYELN